MTPEFRCGFNEHNYEPSSGHINAGNFSNSLYITLTRKNLQLRNIKLIGGNRGGGGY